MKEQEYIAKVDALFNNADSDADFDVVAKQTALGLKHFPNSFRLLIYFGDSIQLGSGSSEFDLSSAKKAYEKAIQVAPDEAEAFESLGCFLDAIEDDPNGALKYLEKAVELGGGAESWAALGRVLSQIGISDTVIIQRLSECSYSETPEVKEMIEEVNSGSWSPN